MAFRNESSARLYEELLREGYDRNLCYTIAVKYMNTDYMHIAEQNGRIPRLAVDRYLTL